MAHPSEPHRPPGGAEHFGETQAGVPNPSAGNPPPVPPQSAPHGTPPPYQQQYPQAAYPQQPQYPTPQQPQYSQPRYPQPQYSQPQYPQNQYSQPQYPQPQYPQNQFPQGAYPPSPYGPGPFPFGQPVPPKKSRTPLVLSLIGLVVVIAAAIVTVGVFAPWKSSDVEETTETFSLGNSVTVEVRLPAGWEANLDSVARTTLVRIHQDGDDRSLSQVSDDLKALRGTGSGSAAHTVAVFADKCPSSTSGSDWTTKNRDDSSPLHSERWIYASSRMDDRRCLSLSGVDGAVDAGTAGTKARDLVKKLIDEDRVSAAKAV